MTFSNPAAAATDSAATYIRALLDLLGDRDPFAIMEEHPHAVRESLLGLPEAVLRKPERSGKWSLADVVHHLVDTEIVYGYRFRVTVAHDRPTLPGYDQDLFASRLHYDQMPVADALDDLAHLRPMNLRFLRRLPEAELDRVGLHSERGEESVRRGLKLIAAHDLVHQAQIERIKKALGVD